jgi:phosphoribosyl-AMP cyclohydrolase / phosphoribosyl-ATP pyrophosphohydrolase
MLRKLENIEDVNFNKLNDPKSDEKLVPCVVVSSQKIATDGLAAILMVGFMNESALQATMDRGRIVFYSRTDGQLWEKGQTSGNFLHVIGIYIDCDADTLLIDADPAGPTCHTGARSCFEVSIIGE